MPPQDPSMQTAPDPRAELERLRKIKRLRELEAKASGQPVAPAGPSLRSETDAIIEEAAANIPGGYEAFNRKPADPQRMAAMGYVPDPLAKSGYAKPRAPEAPTVNTAPSSNYLTDVVRGLEAPIVGLTGGGLEGWAKTTAQDPVLGATQAVEFISPVDDAARAYQGLKQAGAGLIDGDMQKAAEGAQQFAIDGSFTAMQALPGSMTLRGVTGVATPGRNTLALNMADLERSAVQATRAPPVRKAPPAPVAPVTAPKPFSAPAEPAGGGLVRRNADRIIGGAVGATIGGAGDAYAAPGDGNGEGNGGPLNAGTGAFLGAFGPRMVASSASRGFRAMARPIRPKGFDERVAARAVRNALKAGGITNADEASAAFTARFGDKPAAIADLTQEGVSTAAGLSRRAGATGEAARARGEELLQNRAGRLERDIGQANPNLNPATITGDVERMVALAQEQATPAYAALRQGYPLGSLTSPRLEQLSQIDSMAPHIKAVNDYRATTAATEGRVVGDFEYWDLVKRDIDAKEQQLIAAGATMDDIRLRKLEDTRNALVQELDTLVPDYPAARQLGGEAPKMRESMRQGQRILGQYQTAEEVARLVAGITGQAQLTALQAGVIRSMVQKTEGATGAMASLMSAGSRRKLSEVFGPEAAEALQARFAADAAIVQNAQRINPNIGSVTSQAQMGEGGFLPMAAEAIRAFRSPIEATLAAMSKGGAYSKAQRDLMGQMLLEGATPENLARIFGNRGGRGGRPAPPPPPTGGGAGPARGPTVPPAPTGPAPRARPAPSEEAVMSAMAQVTQPAKGRPMVGPPTRDTIWDGPIPTKPQSLRGWIRSQGGINDRNYMTGDMKAVMGRANGMPGLINRESGTGLDELARKAYQEGFDVDPEDAGTLMRLLEEEFAGSPSYRIGAKEEWEAYQDTLRARRGDLPGQTSSSPPMVGGAALGALTSGGATYAATGDEDLALKAGILGGIGGGVVGSRFGKGSTPKAPPAVKPKPAFDQRFMKEAQRLVSYNGGVDKALKAQQYVIDQLKNSKAPNAQDRLNRAVSIQYAIRRMAERSNRELDEIVPMAEAAPTGPKPIDPNTNYNIDPRGDKFVIRTDAGEEVLGAPQFSDRKQALAWLQGETRKARQGGAAATPRSGPPGVKPPPVKNGFGSRDLPMDEASRMGRAREMGFDVEYPVYHGSRKGGGFDEFQTSARGRFGPGVYFSEQPSVAGKYGEAQPYVVPTTDQLFDAMPRWNSLSDDAEQRIIKQLRPHEREKLAAQKNWYKREGEAFWEALRRSVDGDDGVLADARASEVIQAAGFKGIRGIGDGQETVIFDPKNIRRTDAAFDPSQEGSSKLLAGMSGNAEAIGAGTGAVLAPDADGDGEISFGERAGAAITGGVLGNVARRASGTGAPKVKPPPMRGPDQAGIKAYHGSPHDFDKFDSSKIGTGEGAQSYGRGLYFAENEGVARSYRDALKLDKRVNSATDRFQNLTIDGEPLGKVFNIDTSYVDELKTLINAGDMAGVKNFLTEKGARWKDLVNDPEYQFRDYAAEKVKAYDGLLSRLDQGGKLGDKGAGRLYEVDINADPADFLDWDRPLSEQKLVLQRAGIDLESDRPKLQQKIADVEAQLAEHLKNRPQVAGQNEWDMLFNADERTNSLAMELSDLKDRITRLKPDDITGSELMRRLGGGSENAPWEGYGRASDRLKQAKVPGIKYLDQGSRGAGDGTRNYVVFDDSAVNIINKQGFGGGGPSRPKPPPKGQKAPPKGPGTVSRMVAGGAVGGIAGSLGGDANAQEDLTAEMAKAEGQISTVQQEIAALKKAKADFDKITDPFEKQRFLKAAGLYPGTVDGINSTNTTNGINAWDAKNAAALEKAEKELAASRTTLDDLRTQDAYRQMQKEQNPFFDAVRELGPSGAAVLGGVAATVLRMRGVGKSKAAVKQIEKDINDLLTNGPVKKLIAKGGAANQPRNRAVNMNEFYRRGGTPDNKLPFNYGPQGWKANPKAAKPGSLYKPETTTKMDGVGSQFIRPTDIKIIGAGLLDSALVTPFVSEAEEELKKAKEDVENGNESIEALRRVEKAKTDLAMYQAIQRLGWGIAGAGALGVAYRYKLPRPDIRGAEDEVTAISDYLKSKAPPKPPRTPQALPPPPATPQPPPIAASPSQLLLPLLPPPPAPKKPKPKPKKP